MEQNKPGAEEQDFLDKDTANDLTSGPLVEAADDNETEREDTDEEDSSELYNEDLEKEVIEKD